MNEGNVFLERAIEVAVVAHAGRIDKYGNPCILHPLRVMFAVRDQGGTVHQQAASVLHDVIQDCGVPDAFLVDRFPPEVCDMVDALTRIDAEDCEAFLRRVAKTPGALLVKEQDIRDNHAQVDRLTDEARRSVLCAKYEAALMFLNSLDYR